MGSANIVAFITASAVVKYIAVSAGKSGEVVIILTGITGNHAPYHIMRIVLVALQQPQAIALINIKEGK